MTLEEKKELLLQQCGKKQNVKEISPETHPIHITEWGNSEPTILMIHGGVQGGLGGGPINFINQKELAAKGYKLRVPSRPGFGESPSRGVDSQTADAVWIAEQLGKSSHLVGHSFGGAEALLAAAIRPEAVQSLVLIEPALQPISAAARISCGVPNTALRRAHPKSDALSGWASRAAAEGFRPPSTASPIHSEKILAKSAVLSAAIKGAETTCKAS